MQVFGQQRSPSQYFGCLYTTPEALMSASSVCNALTSPYNHSTITSEQIMLHLFQPHQADQTLDPEGMGSSCSCTHHTSLTSDPLLTYLTETQERCWRPLRWLCHHTDAAIAERTSARDDFDFRAYMVASIGPSDEMSDTLSSIGRLYADMGGTASSLTISRLRKYYAHAIQVWRGSDNSPQESSCWRSWHALAAC